MKFVKQLTALLLAAVLAAPMLAGCAGGVGGTGGYPVTVGDVTLSSQPSGVVVLSDSLADIVLALGYEGQLKGKGADCTQEDLALLADMTLDDPAAIAGAGANVVLVDTEPTQAQRDALEQAGVQAIVLQAANSRQSLTELYEAVGSVFQGGSVGAERGEKVADSTLLTLDDVYRSIPERSTVQTACYLYDLNGTAVTGDTLAGKLFEYAGLINIFESGSNNSTEGASIKAGNPRYIFCAVGLKKQLMNSKSYSSLSAVRAGRVYEIDAALMERQGGSILQAVVAMAGYAYPELLNDGMSDENISDILDDDEDVSSASSAAKNSSSESEASKSSSSESETSKSSSSQSKAA